MPARFLIILLCLSPVVLFAKQENKGNQDNRSKIEEQDLELFEFIAMYEPSDGIFIDAEMDERTEKQPASQNVTTSK